MSRLRYIDVPTNPTVSMQLDEHGTLTLTGEIAMRNASESISPFFREVHAAIVADGLKEFTLNVAELTFVNSSAVRLFINWVTWAKQVPVEGRYSLVIRTNQKITWQRTSLAVLRALAPGVVTLEPVG